MEVTFLSLANPLVHLALLPESTGERDREQGCQCCGLAQEPCDAFKAQSSVCPPQPSLVLQGSKAAASR